MKHFATALITIFIISCKAQSPVIPLYNSPTDKTSGCYIKDMDNDLDLFEGTWKWENGNNTLVIQFQKIEMYHDQYPNYDNTAIIHRYYDDLIGEYKYIENGIELINYLPLTYNGEDPFEHNIAGATISTTGRAEPPCSECPPNTRFIWLMLREKEQPHLNGKIVMAYFIEGGVEKIRARIFNSQSLSKPVGFTGPTRIKIPDGVYTFIKQ